MTLFELIEYILIGIIQGITEIFPISSSGHVTLLSYFFNLNQDHLTLLLMVTNTGSFLALLLYFRRDIVDLIKGFFLYFFKKELAYQSYYRESWLLVVAVLPVGIVGLLFESLIPTTTFSVGIGLLITTSALVFLHKKAVHATKQHFSVKDALIVGLFQMVAIVPGISRSGITLTGGIFRHIDMKRAMRFSFLAYVLISFPITILSGIRFVGASTSVDGLGFFIAFLLSGVVSYLSVHIFYRWITPGAFKYFAMYTLILSILSLLI
jgi:undecaprenyl-diphosphatase